MQLAAQLRCRDRKGGTHGLVIMNNGYKDAYMAIDQILRTIPASYIHLIIDLYVILHESGAVYNIVAK